MMMALYVVIIVVVLVCLFMTSRLIKQCHKTDSRVKLEGCWISSDGKMYIFGCDSAGYCESDGVIDTFSFNLSGEELSITQDCEVRRYKVKTDTDSYDSVRLEGMMETIVLNRSDKR